MKKLKPRPKLKFITHQEVMKRDLKDPKFKKAYEDLGPYFEIIEALIDARFERKITQREFAKRIGIAQSALARFESGKTNPTLSFLTKLTKGLGLKLVVVS